MQAESKQMLWWARLREHAESGQQICPWCALNGVTEASFHYWRKQLKAATSPVTQLIALPFADRRGEPMLELETPHGYDPPAQRGAAWLARRHPCGAALM